MFLRAASRGRAEVLAAPAELGEVQGTVVKLLGMLLFHITVPPGSASS